MKKIFVNIWYHTIGYIINNLIFLINYSFRYRQYEYVYHMLGEEMKTDPDAYTPGYNHLRRIIGTGGTELLGCNGISDVDSARKYERIFKKYCIVCSYNSDVSKIYQRFKEEYYSL